MGYNGNRAQLVGCTFGFLTARRRAGRNRSGRALWVCECKCGEQIVVRSDKLQDRSQMACNINGHRWTGWIEERGLKRHCIE